MRNFLALVMAFAFIPATLARTEADNFGARHWPAGPVLNIDNDPQLCKQVLDGAKDAFASSFHDLDMTSSEVKFLDWAPAFNDPSNRGTSSIGRLDLDLDGDGKKEVVIFRSVTQSWRGDWHYAYVFPSVKAYNALSDQVKEEWTRLPEDSQYPDVTKLYLGARQYYPTALTNANEKLPTGDVWADHRLFAWKGKYYFYTGTTEFDRLRPMEISVYQLHANGSVKESCRIGLSGDKEAYATLIATPGIESLLKEIHFIGEGGEDCGTMHSGFQHDEQAASAERNAAIRPWAVSLEHASMTQGNPYYVFDDRTKKFLEYWSLEDLWTRREYQTFLEHIGPAETGFATYLIKEFGVEPSKAKSDAAEVIQQLIGARFILPNEFDFTEESRKLYFGEYSIGQALVGRDWKAINAMLGDPKSVSMYDKKSDSEVPYQIVLSKVLDDAVELPNVLDKMLKAGANPNQPNEFGKTPLMIAAHLDRPDSVRILLNAHADVNAVTHNVKEFCSNGFERVGRSALTYAVENASPIVIKLLLDAGADPNIRDSKGNGLDFYLAKNPRLTSDEQKLGVTGLSKISDQFSGPSFKCQAAKTPIEKAICKSEVLRILDLELARAYELLRANQGPLAVTEQRQWVKRRNSSCNGANLSEDCLAEIMRTRIRYLHNRNSENLPTK